MTEDDLQQLLVDELGFSETNSDACTWVVRELLEIGELREREDEHADYIAELRFDALLPKEPERSCVLAWVGASGLIEQCDECDDFAITERGAELLAWFKQQDAEEAEEERKMAN